MGYLFISHKRKYEVCLDAFGSYSRDVPRHFGNILKAINCSL